MFKQIFTLLFLMICIGLSPNAAASNEPAPSADIDLEVHKNENGTKPHRAPMHVNIDAFYDSMSRTISIVYGGEAEGEVFLYLNGAIVDHSPEINTTFMISAPGLYEIEVVSESWTATGSFYIDYSY